LVQSDEASRSECDAAGYPTDGCFVGAGVNEAGDPNTVKTFPETYYGRISGQIAEEFVYDASFIKLRQVQLSYRLPQSILRRSPIKMATVSVVGRNLWLIHSNVPNVDPESNFNNSNAQGLELAGVPQTRS